MQSANDNQPFRVVNVWTNERVRPSQAEMRMFVDAERMAVRSEAR